MSQRDGFASGFIFGAIVGGAIGGIVGVLAASKRSPSKPNPLSASEEEALSANGRSEKLDGSAEQSIEMARRSLEDKIAQLNSAIDDVRQQLSSPASPENGDRE